MVVQAEVHAPMEPLEPEVPVDPQKIHEPLDQDQGNPPPTPEESVEQEARSTRGTITGTYSYSSSTISNGARTIITSSVTYAQTYAIT